MSRPFCVIVDTRGFSEYHTPGQPFHLERIGWDCLFLTQPQFLHTFPQSDSLRAEAVDYSDPILSPDFEALRSRVRCIGAARRIDGISVSLESMMLTTAELRAELGIQGARPADADALRDKLRMKALVAARGLRVPRLFTARDAIARHLGHGREVVVKPRRGYGSRDVCFVATMDALDKALGGQALDACVVEERIHGSVFHVDSLVHENRPVMAAVFAYSQPPHKFVAGEPRLATSVDPGEIRSRLLAFNRDCVEALSPGNTATHLEVYLTPEGELVFGEVGARPGGGHAGLATSCVFGRNSFAAHAALQVGAELPAQTAPAAAAGWVKILKIPGRVRAVTWPDRAAWPWVIAEQRAVAAGDVLGPPAYNGDVSASFAVHGDSQVQVLARLQACIDALRIDYETGKA